MIIKVIKNNESKLIETNAPVNVVEEHFNNEYLANTELKDYIEQFGYEYKEIKAGITLNYDY